MELLTATNGVSVCADPSSRPSSVCFGAPKRKLAASTGAPGSPHFCVVCLQQGKWGDGRRLAQLQQLLLLSLQLLLLLLLKEGTAAATAAAAADASSWTEEVGFGVPSSFFAALPIERTLPMPPVEFVRAPSGPPLSSGGPSTAPSGAPQEGSQGPLQQQQQQEDGQKERFRVEGQKPHFFGLFSSRKECQNAFKAAFEAAASEALLPSLRSFLSAHAEPPPLMPLFLGGTRPPVPFVLPTPSSLPDDLLASVLKRGVIRVGLLGSRALPSSLRSIPPLPSEQQQQQKQKQQQQQKQKQEEQQQQKQEEQQQQQQQKQQQEPQEEKEEDLKPFGLSFRVLEVGVSLLSHNYASLRPGTSPLRVEYREYSSRGALLAALLAGEVDLTELASPYSNVQTAANGFPSARLHAALAAHAAQLTGPTGPPEDKQQQQQQEQQQQQQQKQQKQEQEKQDQQEKQEKQEEEEEQQQQQQQEQQQQQQQQEQQQQQQQQEQQQQQQEHQEEEEEQQQQQQQEQQEEDGVFDVRTVAESSLLEKNASGPPVWGLPSFYASVSAGTPWAAAPVLLSTRREWQVQRLSDLGVLLMQQGVGAPLLLIEASFPELADIAATAMPPQTLFGLVSMEAPLTPPGGPPERPPPEALEDFAASFVVPPLDNSPLPPRDKRLPGAPWPGALAAAVGGPPRAQEGPSSVFGSPWNPSPMGAPGASINKEEGGPQEENPVNKLGGVVLPGDVPLLSLSEALYALQKGTAVGLLHATPLGEALGGPLLGPSLEPFSLRDALPWLLEADAGLTLPLSPFYKRPKGSDCLPRNPRDEFAALAAAAAAAATETRRIFLMPDEEI